MDLNGVFVVDPSSEYPERVVGFYPGRPLGLRDLRSPYLDFVDGPSNECFTSLGTPITFP